MICRVKTIEAPDVMSSLCGNTVENCQGITFKLLFCMLQLDVHFIQHACLNLHRKILYVIVVCKYSIQLQLDRKNNVRQRGSVRWKRRS